MSSDSGVICQIRAGKCRVENDLAQPDLRKGTLRLYKGMDELLCIQWLRRDEEQPEDTFYVFEDAYLQRVDECTDGEVYALKFTGNSHRVLYWMQETSLPAIKAFVNAVNSTIGYQPMETDK